MTTFDGSGEDDTLHEVNDKQQEDQARRQEAWEASAAAREASGPPPQTASEKQGTSVAISLSSTQQVATSNPDFIQPDHLPPLKSKCIFVFKNGDTHFPAKRVVINRKEVRTWRSFLDTLTDSVQTSKGAVRRLHTPRYGHIVHDFNELQHNAQYVAVGREKYKTLDYLDIKEPERFVPTVVPLRQLLQGEKLASRSGPEVPSRYSSLKIGKVIKVYPNGNRFSKPTIVALRPMELLAMRYVVRAVAERMELLNGVAVRRLYTLEGDLVRHAADLQNNGLYVAGGFEKFMPCEYGNEPPPIIISPRRPNPVKYLAAPPTREQSEIEQSSSRHRSPTQLLANESQRSPRQTLQKFPLPPIGGERDFARVDPFYAHPKETSFAPQVAESRATRVLLEPEHLPPPAFETREPLPAIAPSVHQLQPVEESSEAASAQQQQQGLYPYAPQEFEQEPEAFRVEEEGLAPGGGGGGEGGAGGAESREPAEPPLAPSEQAEHHPELLEGAQFADADVDPEQMGAAPAPAANAPERRQQVAFLTERPSNEAAAGSYEDRDQQVTARLAEMPPDGGTSGSGEQWEQFQEPPIAEEGGGGEGVPPNQNAAAPPEEQSPAGDVASASADEASAGLREDLPPPYDPAAAQANDNPDWPALNPPAEDQPQPTPAAGAGDAGTAGTGANANGAPADTNANATAEPPPAQAQQQ